MRGLACRIRRPSPRFLLLPLLLGGVLAAGGLRVGLIAQDRPAPKKAAAVAEDRPPAHPARGKTPRRSKNAGEVEDKPDETQAIDLAAEAGKVQGPVHDFLGRLADPHDDVVMPSGRVDHVVPLPRFLGSRPQFSGEVTLTRIGPDGKRTRLQPVRSREITGVVPFEQIVTKDVTTFLEKPDLPRVEAAEKALAFALRFHLTRRHREGEDARKWAAVETALRDKLLEVRRSHVAGLAGVGEWQKAFALAEQLARDHPRQLAVQLDPARLALQKAGRSGQLDDYMLARKWLIAFEGQFPQAAEAEPVRQGLRQKTERMVGEADALAAERKKSVAIYRLRQAIRLWPQLPGLQAKLNKLDDEHPILYVGVDRLPEYLSPATAWTDPEKQAVELLFEGLVKPCDEAGRGCRYRPALAEGRPRVIPVGREFQLARDAFWSDGNRVTATDVRDTVQLLKSDRLAGRNSEWARLVEDPRVEGTPYQVRITLRTGFLDPLALMTFKVLPHRPRGKGLTSADDESFAKDPVGSGPYQYQGTVTHDGRREAVFVANPFYQRSVRPGRPFIQEIRFYVAKKPAEDLTRGPMRLLLDLPTERIKDLVKKGFKEENVRTLANRRVYFLAVNNQNDSLQSQQLRLALAHAIDREAILDAHFRAGFAAVDRAGRLLPRSNPEAERLHPALNGPYPAGSWASAPSSRVPPALYNPDRARTMAKEALTRLRAKTVELTLKYPAGDPRVEKACQDICAQAAKVAPALKITPAGLEPRAFRKAILDRDYDLAYCHHDYADDTYWLWPLFDPSSDARKKGGSNFLRYENDDVLESLFRKAMNHRDFAEVKKYTHDIHARLYEKMPLIPLWQLHTHLAVHPLLTTAGVDPLRVFSSAEEWRLESK